MLIGNILHRVDVQQLKSGLFEWGQRKFLGGLHTLNWGIWGTTIHDLYALYTPPHPQKRQLKAHITVFSMGKMTSLSYKSSQLPVYLPLGRSRDLYSHTSGECTQQLAASMVSMRICFRLSRGPNSSPCLCYAWRRFHHIKLSGAAIFIMTKYQTTYALHRGYVRFVSLIACWMPHILSISLACTLIVGMRTRWCGV